MTSRIRLRINMPVSCSERENTPCPGASMPSPTTDIPWLSCLVREIASDLAERSVRIRRHADRPRIWIDGGSDRSWTADLTPGSARLYRARSLEEIGPSEEWRDWGGRRTEGAKLVSGDVLGCDRALTFELRWSSRLGEEFHTDLVIELGGRHTNAVILDTESRKIVDVIRPVSGKVNRHREVLPGRRYEPPPRLGRMRIDEPWEWHADGDDTLRDFLRRRFLGGSAWWFDELCHRCGLDGDEPAAHTTEENRHALEHMALLMIHDAAPHILIDSTGDPVDHIGYELTHQVDVMCERAESCADAIDRVWGARERVQARTHREQRYRSFVKRRRTELERRRENLAHDLEKAENADELHRNADLIIAGIDSIPPRASEADLVDWYDPEQRTVTVHLDPDRPPVEQAEQMYRRARKLRESRSHIKARLAKTMSELAALPDADDTPTEEILKEMARKEAINAPADRRTDANTEGIRPRRYRTREGNWLVLAGKNNRENDAISLKIASSDDLWFHAHGCPGSHVVLRKEGRPDNPSRQAIAEAAAVAAYWSKSRGAQKVGVSYTEAKHVRKLKGAPPGTVNIRHEKLITVPPALLPTDDESSDPETEKE